MTIDTIVHKSQMSIRKWVTKGCKQTFVWAWVAVSASAGIADQGLRQVTSDESSSYSPPIIANGDIGLMIDYRNCQFQDVPSYKSIHAAGVDFLPGIYRAGRRTENGNLADFGRIEERVSIPGDENAAPVSWRQRLDIEHAVSEVENVYRGDSRIRSTAFVAAHVPVLCIRKSFEGEMDSYSFDYLFCRRGSARRLPLAAKAEFGNFRIDYTFDRADKPLSGRISMICDASNAVCEQIDCGLRITLAKPRGSVCFLVAYDDSMDERPVDVEALRRDGFQTLYAEHAARWRGFWAQSSIDIPDARIADTWRTAQYNLKCWSTKWSIPVGILPTHWHGAYFGFTFFSPALCSSGHIGEALKVARFWDSVRPAAQARAGKPGWDADAGLRYSWQSLENGGERASGGRWLDHYLHLPNISRECWTAWLYTNDRTLLASNVYPVVKGCAQFFQSRLVAELKDGRTVIMPVCDLERLPCPARNAFLTTCGAIYCLERAADGATLLGVDSSKATEWRRIAAALKRDLPRNGTRYLALEGYEGTSVALLSGLMPYGVLPKDDPFQIASVDHFERNGLKAGNMYSVGKRICTWYAAWLAGAKALLGDGDGAYRNLKLATASVGRFSEIFEINEPAYRSCPWCSSPQGTYIEAVNDMLLQCAGDDICIAPAVPAEWRDFSFRLRAHDDVEVSARFAGGKPVSLRLRAGARHSGRIKKIKFADGRAIDAAISSDERDFIR